MSFNYNPSIPNPPDDPADDVYTMQTNAQSISDLIKVDHVGFNNTNAGNHNQVTFISNQDILNPGLGVARLFSNTLAPGVEALPFWRNATHLYQLATITTDDTDIVTNGYITIGTMVLQWGRKVTPTQSGSVNFNIPFPSGNAPFIIQLTPYGSSSNRPCSVDNSTPPDANTFFYLINSGNSGVDILYWFAIGN